MAKQKLVVSGNPMQIEWPQDQYHVTKQLKTAGVAAASRVNGHDDKLAVFLQTMDIIRAHGIAHYKKMKVMRDEAAAVNAELAAKEARRNEERTQGQITSLKAQLEHLEGAEEKSADV